MATTPFQFTVKSVKEIHDDIVRTYRAQLIALGISNPNTAAGSDIDVLAWAVANEIAVVEANAQIKSDATMPDTAVSDDLDRWLFIFGIARRAGSQATGLVRLSCSVPAGVLVPVGSELKDAQNLRYQVVVGGVYADGALIPVASIDVGAATNKLNGDALTWQNQPPYSAATALVGTLGGSDGISNGADAEGDEIARSRLLARLQNPPSAGNWQQIAEFGEAATPRVEKCFVYPTLQGPATLHYAVTARATATSKSRVLDAITLNGLVVPYVAGLLPEHVWTIGTATVDVPTDVAVMLSLPSSPTASPPGPGGGWLDGSPWPSTNAGTPPIVSAVTSSTNITVTAQTPPQDGISRIAFYNPRTFTIYQATVLSHTGTAGAYVLTLDQPLAGIAVNDCIFPQSQNQAVYIAAMLAAFAAMGPGEKTANPTWLAFAYRRPRPTISWVYSLGATQLKAMTDSGAEVADAQWLYRSTTTPAVPGSVLLAPNILTPRNIGFYPS